MPLYDYRCTEDSCGAVQEAYRRYENRDDAPACACGSATKRAFLPPQVMRDIGEYVSTIDGTFISTRSAHRDHMKRHGVIEMGNEKPKPRKRTIPMDSIRAEMRMQVQRMKFEGKLRER